jgi:1,4-dihydroxy-6-naphthoate synthase
MNISIGFSPCPNDTFIFDALINRKIDTEGITFIESLEDVETLNSHAIESKYDVTKLSYGVYPAVKENYVILNSGSALGTGVGPLLISNTTDQQISVEDQMIAIPGINTTAHFLFSIAYPNAVKKVFLRYDEIESFVLEGKGLGVIIHENRFTYLDKGLKKIIDLGEFWENENHVPIPLGGIVVKRNLDKKIQQKIDGLIKKSIEYAFSNYPELNDYICSHAREMSEEVMRKHIDLYVNNYSLSLGDVGRNAISKMMEFLNKKNEMVVLSDLFVG